MKFQIKFKTPGVVDDALAELECQCNGPNSCPDCEIKDDEVCKAHQLIKQFVKYGELITVEFDTDAGTATVVKV